MIYPEIKNREDTQIAQLIAELEYRRNEVYGANYEFDIWRFVSLDLQNGNIENAQIKVAQFEKNLGEMWCYSQFYTVGEKILSI